MGCHPLFKYQEKLSQDKHLSMRVPLASDVGKNLGARAPNCLHLPYGAGDLQDVIQMSWCWEMLPTATLEWLEVVSRKPRIPDYELWR